MAIVKDWIAEAAKEIQHEIQGVLGWGVIKIIIARHSPFKQGVAYMEVPRCKTCRSFDLDDTGDGYGACLLSGAGSQFQGDSNDCVKVLPDFGCVQWSVKT